MSETSSRLLELLSLLQARRDWPGAELAERLEVSGRTIRRDVERLRGLGYPVESLTRTGRRLPASRRHRDATAAARRGRGDRDRGRAAHGRSGVGDRHRGDLDPRPRQARAGPAGAPAPSRRRAGVGDDCAPCHRPDRRPPAPDRDRRGMSRLRVPSLRLSKPRRQRHAPRGRAALARQPGAPLVPRRLGPPSRRLADVPASTVSTGPAATGARFTARKLPAKDASAYVERSISGAPSRFEARVTVHASAAELASRLPPYWGTFEPIDAHSCEYRAGDDDLGWLAMRIAMLGVDVEVHEPPELIEHLRALARRLRRATRPAG